MQMTFTAKERGSDAEGNLTDEMTKTLPPGSWRILWIRLGELHSGNTTHHRGDPVAESSGKLFRGKLSILLFDAGVKSLSGDLDDLR